MFGNGKARHPTLFFFSLAGLAIASALLRFWAFSQTPYANGWDSYFYLVQLKSLEETGRMHSPEASLIYPYLRLFYWLTGDYVSGMKLGTAILAGVFTASVFWFSQNSTRKLPFAFCSLLLAGWSLFSPHLTYFAAQYPKNLLGVVLLVMFIGSLAKIRVRDLSQKPRGWIFPFFLLILNYFGHRLTFSLAVAYLVFWLVFQYRSSFFLKLFSLKNLLCACVALGFFYAAGQIFPGLFHLADFGRLEGVLDWRPQFAPYSFASEFGLERISGWWLFEVCAVAGFWLLAAGLWLWRKKFFKTSTPLLVLCSLLLFPFLEWSFTGVAWRFFLVFILLTPLLVIDFQIDNQRRSGLVFAAILSFCSLFSWKSYHPKQHDPDYAAFAQVTERARQILAGKYPELIIAPNVLSEFFTFTTGVDAMPWLPEYSVDSNRLWRIATGVHPRTLEYYAGANQEEVRSLGYQYFLMPEHVWQSIVRKAELEKDEDFLTDIRRGRNPLKVRPGWLLRRKRSF